MHYATTKTNTTELHRQDAGKVDGYCGKFAPDRVDPESASMGLASRIMRTCRKCDEIAEDRRRAELSLADGLFVTELATSSAPVVAEESLFGAEELADLYVAPKHRQPRRSAAPQDGGLFGDAELTATQGDAPSKAPRMAEAGPTVEEKNHQESPAESPNEDRAPAYPKVRYSPNSVIVPDAAAEILAWAAEHIENVGLHQGGRLFAGPGRTATLPCLPRGAVSVAAGEGRFAAGRAYDYEAIWAAEREALRLLAEQVTGQSFEPVTDRGQVRERYWRPVDAWGMGEGRTAAEVAQVMRAAAVRGLADVGCAAESAAEGSGLEGAALPEHMAGRPAHVPDVVTGPGTMDAWEDEGGACRDVPAPTPAPAPEPDLFLSHVHADGTILRGSVKGDGVWDILKDLQCGWSWSRKVDFLFITHSRDDIADRWKIRRTAEALRAAGWSVGVTVDNHTKRPVAEREADKYERAEERTEKFDEWAANASTRAESAWKAGHRIADGIPFGQPILVGHHSERRARRDAARIDSAMRQSIDQTKRAARHAERAAAAGAFKAYRTNPARTLRRIETLETELRRVCAAFNSPWCSLAEAPNAERRDDMTVRCDDLTETVEYWRGVIADAEADGFKVWGPDDFAKGDFALYSGSWYQVGRKPGKKSVSVAWNLRLSPKMIMTLEDATGDDGKARTRPAHYSKITARLSAQDMAGFMERGRVPSEAEAHALAAGERWQPKAAAAAVEPREGGTTDVANRLRAMLAEGEQITKFPDRESDVTLACGRRYRVRMVRDKHARETRFDFLVRTADAGTLIGKEEDWAGVLSVVRGHAAAAQESQGTVCRHCGREWGVALGSPEQPTSCTPQTWAFCDRAALEPRVTVATARADTDNATRPAVEVQRQEAEAGEHTEGSGQGQAETTQQEEESGPTCQQCGRYINPEASTYAGECSPSHWLYCNRAPQGQEPPEKKPEAAHALEITAAIGGGFNARCSCNGLYSWALDRAKVEEDAREHLSENGQAAKTPEPMAAACPMCRSERWDGTRCAHCHHNPAGAPVAKTEPGEQDGPAVVFIASQNTAPTYTQERENFNAHFACVAEVCGLTAAELTARVAAHFEAAAPRRLAIEGAPVRAALPAPQYVKGQHVVHTPRPITTADGVTVCGLESPGTFERYTTYGRAYMLRHGDCTPVLVEARDLTADTAPSEHVTRVVELAGEGGRSRAGYFPRLTSRAAALCSCGWTVTIPGANWPAALAAGRQHADQAAHAATAPEPRRVIAPPYAAPPRVFAMEPATQLPAAKQNPAPRTAPVKVRPARRRARCAPIVEPVPLPLLDEAEAASVTADAAAGDELMASFGELCAELARLSAAWDAVGV
ncbi:DUF6197 family protein [Streptomyces sioyaensis]|uniref:DUF6197 family protein n=1 Tax=Streptomyces sioyaensis TaxID=67364 RepID=UPI003D74FF6E